MRAAEQADIEGPKWVKHRLYHAAQRGVGARHAGMGIAIARAGGRHVHGEYERLDAGGHGALQRVLHEAAILQHIKLKPDRRGGCLLHFLDGADGDGREREGNVARGRSAGRLHFAAARIHTGEADGRERHGHGHLAAEEFCGDVQTLDILEDTLAQFDLGEVRDVAAERVFGIGTTVDVMEQEGRQAAAGGFAII